MGRDITLPSATLSALLSGIVNVGSADDRNISSLVLDSRNACQGSVFFACTGHHVHGLHFAQQAIERGAVAVIYDPNNAPKLEALSVPTFAVADLSRQLSLIADRFYGSPSRALPVIGVTGTDGKTSTTQFIGQLLRAVGRRCGVIGTLGWSDGENSAALPNTTPDGITVQDIIYRFQQSKCDAVAMEVSSHALALGRVASVQFDTAVFTNLGRDHLDFHGSVEAYGQTKARLFQFGGLQRAIINLDDPFGRSLASNANPSSVIVGYGIASTVDDARAKLSGLAPGSIYAADVVPSADGLAFTAVSSGAVHRVSTPLFGRFNVYNVLAAIAAVVGLGVAFKDACAAASLLSTIPGRMERFGGGDKPLAVVDYAHTPYALGHVLAALREHCEGSLWCIFGCGGDRDAGKRPLMGAAAEEIADELIITDDNPRSESGDAIVQSILGGMQVPARVRVERDRGAALLLAISAAQPGDVILVAGKGHEDYQIVGDQSLRFSDREHVARLLGEL